MIKDEPIISVLHEQNIIWELQRKISFLSLTNIKTTIVLQTMMFSMTFFADSTKEEISL